MIFPLLTCLLISAAPVFDVRTLDGRTLTGTLSALSSEELTLETAEGPVALRLDVLLELAAEAPGLPPAAAKTYVYLVDGSVLAAEEYTSGRDRAKVVLCGGTTVELPTRVVRGVQFRTGDEESDEWAKILDSRPGADVLVVGTGEHLDTHSGVLHDVTVERVHFELDGEELPVNRAKIYGLIYHHPAEANLFSPRGFLFDTAGSKWAVGALMLSDQLHGTTPAGLPLAEPLENVVRLDLSLGKIHYLSDLNPESAAWTPFFSGGKSLPARQQFFSLRKDKNFESDPLRIAGKTYRKGLALHSRTEIVYRLPAGFHRFKAVAGIDDAVRPQGNVRLLIRGDENVLWEATIRGADLPRALDLDISQVRRLAILVDFGADLSIGDYLDLGDARITK